MNNKSNASWAGHAVALLTIIIWGTTFISTKVLLNSFTPVEILLIRFIIGLAVLFAAYPHRLKGTTWQQELTFLGAGLSGVTIYYLLENIALTYTLASNVSVICSAAPFFTAICLKMAFKDSEKITVRFFTGFVIALAGIGLINFSGQNMQLNPIGDLMALGAAAVWGFYSVFSKKMSTYGYPVIQTTRRTFEYGILCMLPFAFGMGFKPDFGKLAIPENFLNLLYLGIGACAICFVTWNMAVRMLGALKTSVYIYLIPVITIVMSVVILHEPLTPLSALGTCLTLVGLIVSEKR